MAAKTSIVAKISARAKQIRAEKPTMKWTAAIKQAAKELKGQKTTSAGTRKKNVGAGKRRKTYFDFDFAKAYDRAPLKVRRVLDTLHEDSDYAELQAVANQLESMGWFFDFDLGREVVALHPINKRPRVSGAKQHKDTRSHNVNIKVGRAGSKRKVGSAKATKPKIQTTSIRLDKLNGINPKFKIGQYYVVDQKGHPNDGTVFRIHKGKRQNPLNMQTEYPARVWEPTKTGFLRQPFDAYLRESWLHQTTIRPRAAVKSNELL